MPFVFNSATNKWEWEGDTPDDNAPVAVAEAPAPAAPAARPPAPEQERENRPWYEKFVGRYNPLFLGGKALDNLKNDIRFELKQYERMETAIPRFTNYLIRNAGRPPGLGIVSPRDDFSNTMSLGGFKAQANAKKAILDATGQLTPAREGRIDEELDAAYRANGFRPPSEMTDEELVGDDVRSSFVLNAALAAVTAGGSSALAAKYPALAKYLQLLDPTKGKTLAGAAGRFSLGQLADELPSTYLDDNTGGSFPQLLGLIGVSPEIIDQLDPVEPGMSRTEASNAALGPNLLGAGIFAGGLQGLSRALPATGRAVSSRWERSRRERVRARQVEAGEVADPAAAEPQDLGKTLEETEAELKRQVAEEQGKLESDAVEEVIDGNMDDAQLDEVIARQEAGEDTVEIVEDITTRESSAPVQDDISLEATAAPSSNLAGQNIPIEQRFSSVPLAALRSLVANSPELAARITQLTGRPLEALDKTDILEGIKSLEADGNTVMPSRLMGQPVLPVDDIEVDPQRFQFKQGTDAQGQQKGNSLSGVGVWNEGMEGQIQVWEDLNDGKTYVVNGHNRLAKAKSLGVPSMKVEYLNAASAEEARALGALNNIAQGGGTLFDAAKFMRDSGIKDPQELESLGVPMKSGLAADGLSLAQLPDNIFQDAVDGRITKSKALALGSSGLDETGMQAAYKALQARDMSDATFSEVLQQARSAGTAQSDQVDLFGNTETLSLMVQKGELAARVRKDLMADKNLMKRTAANAQRLTEVGNEIDKASTASLADDTAALLAQFDADKYMDTPLSKKLNDGAAQIAEGAKVKPVADRIRRELIEAAENTPAPKTELSLDERIAKKYGDMEPEQLQAEKAKLEKKVLGDRARANREAKVKANDELADQVADFIANPEKYPEGTEPVLPSAAEFDRPGKQLQEDEYARAALKWIEENAPAPTRQEKISKINKTALENGDVRPPATPLPKTPEVPDIDRTQRADVQVLDMLDNELRLKDQYDAVDDAIAADKLEAERSQNGYDLKTFEEKKTAGMLDWLKDLEAAGRKITERNENRVLGAAELLKSWVDRGRFGGTSPIRSIDEAVSIVRAKGSMLVTDNIPGIDLDKALNDQSMGRYSDEVKKVQKAYEDFYGIGKAEQPSAPTQAFTLPADVAKSAPRFGMAKLQFESDLDRAAYIIRNKAKPSKGEARIIKALEGQGYDIPEIRARGDEVKTLIQDVIEEQTGSRRAPQEAMTLQIPDTDAPGVRASQSMPQANAEGPYDEAAFRKSKAGALKADEMRREAFLLDMGLKLPSTVAGMTRLSESLGREMVAGLKEAAKISGLDPLRIQYLDKIDMTKLFGEEAANASLDQWSPNAARFVRENPDDPLTDLVRGSTGGVFVPKDYPSIHRHMIYIALGPALDLRFTNKALRARGGEPLGKTPYHEAFHAVQDWLDLMAVKSNDGSSEMIMALYRDEALQEMTELIKKDPYGNYQKGMAPAEVQAEAFAVWYNNRKIRLKAGGLQAAFERIKKFINTLRRKWRYALDADPTYVDVFELAAEGKISDAGNSKIKKLTPQQLEGLKNRMDRNMDQMFPVLTDRIHTYLKQKQADFDLLNEKLADEIDMEGC